MVMVSPNNSSYITVWTLPLMDGGSWKQVTATISADSQTIIFEFVSGAHTSGNEGEEEAYVDDILVTSWRRAHGPRWTP
jgi:hypothetical protein